MRGAIEYSIAFTGYRYDMKEHLLAVEVRAIRTAVATATYYSATSTAATATIVNVNRMHTLENYADTTFCCTLQRLLLLLFLFNRLNLLPQPNFSHLKLRLVMNRLAS
jgi:hypothetical protein